MSTSKLFLIAVAALSLTTLQACSGGGGGGSSSSTSPGGGGTTSGSALHQDFYGGGVLHNQCIGYTAPSNSSVCSSVGGTWSSSGSTSSCSKQGNGTITSTPSVSCDYGTASAKCVVGSTTYSGVASLASDSKTACEHVGGTVTAVCTITNNSDCTAVGGTWSTTANAAACSGYDVTNSTTCSTLGGTLYSTVSTYSGRVINDGSNSVVVGSNSVHLVQSSSDGALPLYDYAHGSTEDLVRVSGVPTIQQNYQNGSGNHYVTLWTASAINLPFSNWSITDASNASFNMTSSVATSADSFEAAGAVILDTTLTIYSH